MQLKQKIYAGLAAGAMLGSLGFAGPAMAYDDPPPPPPPQKGCAFPPGGQVAPLHSTATPGGRDLVITICSNAGRGEGSEFNGRGGPVPPATSDQDPGGSQPRNRGGD